VRSLPVLRKSAVLVEFHRALYRPGTLQVAQNLQNLDLYILYKLLHSQLRYRAQFRSTLHLNLLPRGLRHLVLGAYEDAVHDSVLPQRRHP